MCDCTSKKRFVCHGNRGGGGCPCICHQTKADIKRRENNPVSLETRLEIGRRLQQARETRGFTKVFVSQAIGRTSATFLTHWEKGISAPMLGTLTDTCRIYGVTVDSILDGLPCEYAGVKLTEI